MSFTNMELAEKGRARIAAATEGEAAPPTPTFPFEWGERWKHCVEYRVIDFDAEVGFFLDVMGFRPNALAPDYAMFTSPKGDFYLSIVSTTDVKSSTPGDSIRLGFMVKDIEGVARELGKRGIDFEKPVRLYEPAGGGLHTGRFRTPNGIAVDLWGVKSE